MEIVREELKKISHFLIILVGLYIVNFIFNMLYDWGGVSVIVRVYIMVLSCYVVYNFSQIDVEQEKEIFRAKNGNWGLISLFFAVRVFPFFFIYLMTVIFALINYAGGEDWPYDTLLRLLDGRYSNTVIYALFLFIILRLKIRPGVSIPVFLFVSVFYFYVDKFLYLLFEPGIGVAIIKIFKFMAFFFILIYGYSKKRLKLFHALIMGTISGIAVFALIVLIFLSIFYFGNKADRNYLFASRTLLKYGFSFVFKDYENSVKQYNVYSDISDLIVFSNKSGYEINMTDRQWADFILNNKKNSEDILHYLFDKKIIMDFVVVRDMLIKFSEDSPELLSKSKNFQKYFSHYYEAHENDFYILYKNGNVHLKGFIIDSLAYIKSHRAVIFLIDKLSEVNVLLAERAYDSLKRISGENPSKTLKKPYYDADVIEYFRAYSARMSR